MPSKFLDQVLADDPVDLGPGWEMDRSDRRFIDDQIQAMQQQMLACLLRGIVATWFRLDAGSAPAAKGDIVCASPSTSAADTVTRALSTALTASGGGALGMMLTATRPGALGLVAMRGIVPPSIHGVAPGTPGVIRVNTSTARCEYVTTLGVGDSPVGTVDASGNITLSFASQAGGAGPGAITPTATYSFTSTSATSATAGSMPLVDNSVTRIVAVGFARDTTTHWYKKKSSAEYTRSSGGSVSILGVDDGAYFFDNIGVTGMTLVPNGNNLDFKFGGSGSVHTRGIIEVYAETIGIAAAT